MPRISRPKEQEEQVFRYFSIEPSSTSGGMYFVTAALSRDFAALFPDWPRSLHRSPYRYLGPGGPHNDLYPRLTGVQNSDLERTVRFPSYDAAFDACLARLGLLQPAEDW